MFWLYQLKGKNSYLLIRNGLKIYQI